MTEQAAPSLGAATVVPEHLLASLFCAHALPVKWICAAQIFSVSPALQGPCCAAQLSVTCKACTTCNHLCCLLLLLLLLQWVVTIASSTGLELRDWQDAFDTLMDNALA